MTVQDNDQDDVQARDPSDESPEADAAAGPGHDDGEPSDALAASGAAEDAAEHDTAEHAAESAPDDSNGDESAEHVVKQGELLPPGDDDDPAAGQVPSATNHSLTAPATESDEPSAATVAPERFQTSGSATMSVFSGGGFHPGMVRWKRMLAEINELESTLKPESEAELRKRSLALRYRAMAGEKLAKLLPEGYALVREAGRRALGMRHYDVQVIGGISLFEGHIAEMQTGEGKTLTATLPLYLHSLVGKGAHLATVNDYLAKRDAEWMTPIYTMLGVSVGIIQTPDDQGSRRTSYGSAVTYGTAKEFGFDFLRDRLLLRAQNRIQTEMLGDGGGGFSDSGDKPVMRGMHFCLVDEADSILIDEARTPLIIGSIEDTVRDQIVETYRWASKHATEYELDDHFTIDDDTKQYELTARGRQKVRALPKSDLVRTMGLVDLYEYTERAVKVCPGVSVGPTIRRSPWRQRHRRDRDRRRVHRSTCRRA